MKTGVKAARRKDGRRVITVHPLRVASDVDGSLEEPKRSANHVMARDADETRRVPTLENLTNEEEEE